MGNARWSDSDYATYRTATAAKPRTEVFKNKEMAESLDPKKIKFRESVDSAANPSSTPIILACDVTGSMGMLAEQIVKHGLGVVMKTIYDHKPVPDPHICCMGIGDASCDTAPLQVTQFEAGVDALTKQVQDIWLEAGGGGNGGESYALAWWFAAYKCKTDRFQKRGKKGYIFTIGDECVIPISKGHISTFMGVGCERDIPFEAMLKIVQESWHVYHLIVKPVTEQPVESQWKGLLNERAVMVRNPDKLAELISTIISINEGVDHEKVTADFDANTARDVKESVKGLLPAGA